LEAVRAGSFAFFTKPIDIKSLIEALDTIIIPKKTPYRIMIIDDDVNLSEHYATVLQLAGMEVITINNPEHCIKCLSEFQPELIMMDMYMPNYTGIELAKVIRQLGTHNNTPIVFLSSEPDLDKQFAALDVGGDAFLTKPIVDKHLITAVHAKVQRARLLASLIVRDSLTGLINNAKIKEELYTEITRAERNHASLSFVMLDIDNFKTVNDTYGHMTGDRVLITLSRLLQEDLRNSDHIGRYGGEEFAIILPATDMPKATYILDRIRKSFEKIRHHHESGSFTCTFSAGIAFFPKHKKVNELIESADKALYKAKDGGRNRIEQFLS
jgi:diguanylate cyclase (GGDEF)-like protein